MTIKQMAQMAIDVQSAVNLSGVVRSFHEITTTMRNEHGMDTPTCNHHPVCVMFSAQIAFLTNSGYPDNDAYNRAYAACRQLVKE